jgi:adenylate cyclase
VSDFGGTFDPLADALPTGNEVMDLSGFLLDAGVPLTEVEQAGREGTLELLALEKIVASEALSYELDEVAALSGVPAERIRAYWRALGFPDPRPGEKLFSDTDLRMLSDVVWFISDGALEPGVALQMARVIGSSLDRIASAQVDTIQTRRADFADGDGDGDGDSAGDELRFRLRHNEVAAMSPEDLQLAVRRGAQLLPMMPKMMEFVWRRHLSDAARRRRLRASSGGGARMCVGFADLVGFTAQTQQLDEEDLADVVSRFEMIAYDVVSGGGGRVVKMIGDEVMFTADDIARGAELALALAETYRNDPAMSDVRVGLASGPVLEREGDVYGPVVNLASRIVSIAYPGAVVVAQDIHDALAPDAAFTFKTIRQHYLKDIGRVNLWTMRHASDEAEDEYRNARDRRAARRDFLLARRAKRLANGHQLPQSVEDEVVDLLEDAGLLDAGESAREEGLVTGDESTQELEAITDVVLAADIDEELQVELLADIEAARRLSELEREAQERAEETDLEAEGRLEEIEEEVRRKIRRIEREAQRQVEEALTEAERQSELVNQAASRKLKRVAADTERKADQAEKDARRIAKRKAAKRKAEKERLKRDRKKHDDDHHPKAKESSGGDRSKAASGADASPDGEGTDRPR